MDNEKDNKAPINELIFALGSLIRRIRSAAPELKELSWTQTSAITRLDKYGPSTIADLARAEGVKHQSMRTAITTLEEMGLVERKPHPTDGRQINIALTQAGKKMKKETSEAKYTWFAEAVQKLSAKDQATLFAAGEIIKKLVDL